MIIFLVIFFILGIIFFILRELWSKKYGKIYFEYKKQDIFFSITVRTVINNINNHKEFLLDKDELIKNFNYLFTPDSIKTEIILYDYLKLNDNFFGTSSYVFCPYRLSEILIYKLDINKFKNFCRTKKGWITKE